MLRLAVVMLVALALLSTGTLADLRQQGVLQPGTQIRGAASIRLASRSPASAATTADSKPVSAVASSVADTAALVAPPVTGASAKPPTSGPAAQAADPLLLETSNPFSSGGQNSTLRDALWLLLVAFCLVALLGLCYYFREAIKTGIDGCCFGIVQLSRVLKDGFVKLARWIWFPFKMCFRCTRDSWTRCCYPHRITA